MPKNYAYSIAQRLNEAQDSFGSKTISHLWLCQVIAYDLKKAGLKFNGKAFSKKCGYPYDITK